VIFILGAVAAIAGGGKCSLITFASSGTLLGCFNGSIALGIIGLLSIVLFGGIIGWIFGKIKERNKKVM
jgi:hypothetical protein